MCVCVCVHVESLLEFSGQEGALIEVDFSQH